MKFEYVPKGVCSRKMYFSIDENNEVSDVSVIGGCQGNLRGLSKLAENRKAEELISLLSGIDCGGKGTSCPDQFAKALQTALNQMK